MRGQRLWRTRIGRLTLVIGACAAALWIAALAGPASAQITLPEAVSDQGDDIRALFFVVAGIGVVVFVIVEAMILWVVFRYRRQRDDEFPTQVAHNNAAEIIWTGIPLVIVVALFIGSLVVLEDVQSAAGPDEEIAEVDVLGRQWAWQFSYGTPLGTELAAGLSEDPAEVEVRLRDSSLVAPFMTLKLGVEHMRVRSREGDVVTVERAVNGTVPIRHSAGEAVERVFNGTVTEPEGRLQDADNTPIVTVPVGRMVRFNIASGDVLHAFYTPQFLTKLDAVPGRVQTLWVRVNEAGDFQSQCAEFCGRDHARMIFTVRALPLADYEVWLSAKTPAAPEAVEGDFGAQEEMPVDEGAVGNPVLGQELYFANGCTTCHGDFGEGIVGPTIAMTVVPLDRVIEQYRMPLNAMQAFPEDRVTDEEIGHIYAWLQTLERPPESEVIPSELAQLIEMEQ